MWYKISGLTVEFRLFAKPNAKQSAVLGVTDNGLGIALKARPQEGEANSELIAFLAKLFHLPKRDIVLRRGGAARHKAVVLPLNEEVKKFIATLEAPRAR